MGRFLSASLIWLTIAALVLPVAPIQAADGDEDAPVVVRTEGTNPATSAQITIEVTEAVSQEQVTRAAELAQGAVAATANEGGKTAVLAVDAKVPLDPTQPPAADIFPRGETLESMAQKIGDGNPKGSEVIVAETYYPSDGPLFDPSQQATRRRNNIILTIARITGIAIGVTTVVTLTKDCPIMHALPIGALAASISGGLQAINGSFQRWLVSRGLFRVGTPGEEPAPHRVTFGKLLLFTIAYLGVFRAGLYAMGLEEGSFFSLENLREVVVSGLLGTSLEYAWDRFISESLNIRTRRDPHNLYRHLMVADAQAATISVVGTLAQILSASGLTVGKIAAGVITAAGVASYAWEKRSPGGFIHRFGSVVKAIVSGSCGFVLSLFGRGR